MGFLGFLGLLGSEIHTQNRGQRVFGSIGFWDFGSDRQIQDPRGSGFWGPGTLVQGLKADWAGLWGGTLGPVSGPTGPWTWHGPWDFGSWVSGRLGHGLGGLGPGPWSNLRPAGPQNLFDFS